MNTDIRIHIEFWSHAKTRKMIRALGLQGPVSLQILWCYVAKNRPNGVLRDMDADDIEDAAGWPAERRGEFFAYCTKNRWLDRAGRGSWTVHEWRQYNSWAAGAPGRNHNARKGAHVKNHAGSPKPDSCEFCREEFGSAESAATSVLPADQEHRRKQRRSKPAPAPAPAPTPAPIATPVSLPSDADSAIEIIQKTAAAVLPGMQAVDDIQASLWLRDVNPDPWWISAVICEGALSLSRAKRPSYVTVALQTKLAEGWTCDDAKGYVEFRLSRRIGATA